MINLSEKYEEICTLYVEAFLRKHHLFDADTGEYSSYEWTADEVGGILEVDDYYIGFRDILYDIDNEVDKDKYDEYYQHNVDFGTEGISVNYRSYLRGARIEKQK